MQDSRWFRCPHPARHPLPHRATSSLPALLLLGLITLFGLGAPKAGAESSGAADLAPRVALHTAQGDIVVELDAVHAPLTTANFLHYVDQKRYDGATFYRTVPIGDDGKYGMLQGGLFGSKTPAFKPIAHESTAVTGLHHVDGTISMGRNAPGTAASEFFIVMGDLTALDATDSDPGYAAFGHVTSGMELVHELLAMPHRPDDGKSAISGQLLATPVTILSARRVPVPAATPSAAP